MSPLSLLWSDIAFLCSGATMYYAQRHTLMPMHASMMFSFYFFSSPSPFLNSLFPSHTKKKAKDAIHKIIPARRIEDKDDVFVTHIHKNEHNN